jgi:hypothetical protein
MNFTQFDLGRLNPGQIVEVTLSGSAANVRLMDSANFSNFKTGRQHRYIGGLIKESPFRAKIPKSGHWFVTIDMNGLQGSVSSAVNVLPGVLSGKDKLPGAHQ